MHSRAFTEEHAKSYGLTGWVRNTSDDKVDSSVPEVSIGVDTDPQVEGEAQGEESALEKLKKDLKEGPKHARVVKLETKDIATKDGESSFTS
jgi:acylphosphatase